MHNDIDSGTMLHLNAAAAGGRPRRHSTMDVNLLHDERTYLFSRAEVQPKAKKFRGSNLLGAPGSHQMSRSTSNLFNDSPSLLKPPPKQSSRLEGRRASLNPLMLLTGPKTHAAALPMPPEVNMNRRPSTPNSAMPWLKESIAVLEDSQMQIESEKKKVQLEIMKNDRRRLSSSMGSLATNGDPQAVSTVAGGVGDPYEDPTRAAELMAQYGMAPPKPSSITKWKRWFSDKLGKTRAQPKPDPIEKASQGLKHAEQVIANMDENLAHEEAELKDRALKLRRQSADAFKLMNDVKKFQQMKPNIKGGAEFGFTEEEEEDDGGDDSEDDSPRADSKGSLDEISVVSPRLDHHDFNSNESECGSDRDQGDGAEEDEEEDIGKYFQEVEQKLAQGTSGTMHKSVSFDQRPVIEKSEARGHGKKKVSLGLPPSSQRRHSEGMRGHYMSSTPILMTDHLPMERLEIDTPKGPEKEDAAAARSAGPPRTSGLRSEENAQQAGVSEDSKENWCRQQDMMERTGSHGDDQRQQMPFKDRRRLLFEQTTEETNV